MTSNIEEMCNNLFMNNIKPIIPFLTFLQQIVNASEFSLNYKNINKSVYMFNVEWQVPMKFPSSTDKSQFFINKYFNNLIIDDQYNIIMYGGPKVYDSIRDSFDIKDIKQLAGESIIDYYKAFEGTTINVYYYDNAWRFSTKKMFNMYDSKFGSTKSHGQMFEEAVNITEFIKLLDPEIIYQFILIHPENTHLSTIQRPSLILMSVRGKNISIPIDQSRCQCLYTQNVFLPTQLLSTNIDSELIDDKYNTQGVIVMVGDYIFRVYNKSYKEKLINNPHFNTNQESLIYKYQKDKLDSNKETTIAAINFVAILLHRTLLHFTKFAPFFTNEEKTSAKNLKFIKLNEQDFEYLKGHNAVIRNINKLQHLPFCTPLTSINYDQVRKHIKYHCSAQDIYSMYITFVNNTSLLDKINYKIANNKIMNNVYKFNTFM